ncbi:hypothetical protein AUJ14_01590 [Candidatus Micrarchaeota archaeon CG1_02_55_22]|nr:MAG: hypothetical protein AUJ14_01590 [Candidatus Micrarchaeota archaeon CG1_02_55_22]
MNIRTRFKFTALLTFLLVLVLAVSFIQPRVLPGTVSYLPLERYSWFILLFLLIAGLAVDIPLWNAYWNLAFHPDAPELLAEVNEYWYNHKSNAPVLIGSAIKYSQNIVRLSFWALVLSVSFIVYSLVLGQYSSAYLFLIISVILLMFWSYTKLANEKSASNVDSFELYREKLVLLPLGRTIGLSELKNVTLARINNHSFLGPQYFMSFTLDGRTYKFERLKVNKNALIDFDALLIPTILAAIGFNAQTSFSTMGNADFPGPHLELKCVFNEDNYHSANNRG